MVLKDLTAISGVSGDEGRVRNYILEAARKLADDVRVDGIGNVIAYVKGTDASAKSVLLNAHMDEVGLIVVGIGDDGLLSYRTVGNIDPRVMVSKRVFVGDKRLPGVVGCKAIHLQSREELKTVLKHDQMYIDIGAKDASDAASKVSPGDYVTLDGEWQEFGEGLVRSRALDDRVGCATLLSLMQNRYPSDVYYAFTVGEEIGCKGSFAAAFGTKTDCALTFEGTSANDLGDVKEYKKVCSLKKGVAISFMDRASIAHRGLHHKLRALAEANGIPWQIKTAVAGGNDSGALQKNAGARATCVLSVPCRYIHSPSSVAAFSDIDALFRLAEAFLNSGAEF